jgi:orotidine-5'-phosphate decarboxylase
MTTPSPVFCAIDRPDLDGALGLCRSLQDVVGGLKIGLEFLSANGPDGIRRVVALGAPVFLDVKFHDIPNTVAGAVRAVASLGVAMLTLHVAGGPAMLRAAVEAARAGEPCPKLLGVTVLTSVDDADLAALGIAHRVTDQVLRLAEVAWNSGLDGVVCSPHEVALLRQRFEPGFKLVVAGIRPSGSARRDQKRVMTPAEAIAAGADHLVIGRPITEAPDPRAAARAIAAEITACGSLESDARVRMARGR